MMNSELPCAIRSGSTGWPIARLVGGVLDKPIADVERLIEVDLLGQVVRHFDAQALPRLGQGVDIGPVLRRLIQ